MKNTKKQIYLAIAAFGLIVIGGIVLNNIQDNGRTDFVGGEAMDGKKYAKAKKRESSYAFPADVEIVEKTWGELIPNDLLEIGGPDQPGWGKIYHDPNDPPEIFTGEYRDRLVLYKGKFEYSQPDGRPLPDNALDDFYMSAFINLEMHFDAIAPKDEFYYFTLKPLGKVIEFDSADADAYREMHESHN